MSKRNTAYVFFLVFYQGVNSHFIGTSGFFASVLFCLVVFKVRYENEIDIWKGKEVVMTWSLLPPPAQTENFLNDWIIKEPWAPNLLNLYEIVRESVAIWMLNTHALSRKYTHTRVLSVRILAVDFLFFRFEDPA